MAPKHGFWTFQENHVISFVWNSCKMKVGKNLVLNYSQKWLLANEILVFFLIINISLID